MKPATTNLIIIKTQDGSCTLKHDHWDETYHSMNGAFTESMHVFINNGLLKVSDHIREIHMLEVGLGTGLNALLTLENMPLDTIVYYTAFEPFPVAMLKAEDYYSQYEIKPKRLDLIEKILDNNYNGFQEISARFNFCNIKKPIQSLSGDLMKDLYKSSGCDFNGFNLVYFDAFAPSKQPEMWTNEILSSITDCLAEQGMITTYCAQGQFRRNLKSLGLKVGSMPGPPGKREMTVATKG